MHTQMIDFVNRVKSLYPDFFNDKYVLDVGSLDINGNNRQFFTNCHYTGIDLHAGKNVDINCPIHKYFPDRLYDTIICTEMLEHDFHYFFSIKRMIELLSRPGLLILTAAYKGRPEHGTKENTPRDSPFTNNYYRNINFPMFISPFFNYPIEWKNFYIETDKKVHDIRFYGIIE